MKPVVVLPMHIEDITVSTECWTFNRLAIIKSSPFYRDWIASHYNLFVDTNNYNFLFGDFSCYTFAYYGELLQHKPINFFQLNRENIIGTIKSFIAEGWYIIASFDYNEQLDAVHEQLLFGYDDEQESFLTLDVINRKFKKTQISYSRVVEVIEKVKAHFLRREKDAIKLSLVFQYPITIVRINKSFSPQNCPFEAYKKMIWEVNSKCMVQTGLFNFDICDDRDQANIVTGLRCLIAFGDMLEAFIEGRTASPWFKGITNAVKKIQEHQQMICNTMEYLAEKWSKAITSEAGQALKDYKDVLRTLDKWMGMCLKYEINGDVALLKRIRAEANNVYKEELKSLLSFINNGFDWQKLNRYYI